MSVKAWILAVVVGIVLTVFAMVAARYGFVSVQQGPMWIVVAMCLILAGRGRSERRKKEKAVG